MTEAALPPAAQFSCWRRAAAARTSGDTVNVDPAGVNGPDQRLRFGPRSGHQAGKMLLKAEIAHRETSAAQGSKQLVAVVAQGL